MGMFSFMTQYTNESIPAIDSSRKTFTVYMVDNKNNVWEEKEYEGYGVFGGKDFYELLAEMNGLKNRNDGIDIHFDNTSFLSPNLYKNKHEWVNSVPKDCPHQGFFYPEADYREDE